MAASQLELEKLVALGGKLDLKGADLKEWVEIERSQLKQQRAEEREQRARDREEENIRLDKLEKDRLERDRYNDEQMQSKRELDYQREREKLAFQRYQLELQLKMEVIKGLDNVGADYLSRSTDKGDAHILQYRS